MANADVKQWTSAVKSKKIAAQTPSASTRQKTSIVLFGKTGNGKSATCNMILGRECSEVKKSQSSVTKQCKTFYGTVKDGREVLVVDTPGLYDTDRTQEETINTIMEFMDVSFPGIHAFLLILSCNGRYTDEEHNTILELKELFGDTVYQHTIVVFTSVDALGDTTTGEYANGFPSNLQDVIKSCSGRVIFVNNKHPNANNKYCGKLFQMIDAMVQENNKGHYTDEMFGAHLKGSKKMEKIRRVLEKDSRQLAYMVWVISMLENGPECDWSMQRNIDTTELNKRMNKARKLQKLNALQKEHEIEKINKKVEALEKTIKKRKGWCSIL